jgi:hypothetical protein
MCVCEPLLVLLQVAKVLLESEVMEVSTHTRPREDPCLGSVFLAAECLHPVVSHRRSLTPIPLLSPLPLLSLFSLQLPENVAAVVHDLIATIEAGDPSLAPAGAGGAADALHIGHRAFCLSNPTAPDCPIVYCSPGFARLTGYEAHSVIGRNCRFLQVTSVTPFLSPWFSHSLSHISLPFAPLRFRCLAGPGHGS